MLVLLVANIANTVAEFAGAAAALEIFGVPRWLTVPVVGVAIWALVLFASYRTVERVFLLGHGRVPRVHRLGDPGRPGLGRGGDGVRLAVRSTSRPAILLLMVALVGTTITPYMQFYLQSAVAEKGIGEEELRPRAGRRDRRRDLDQRDRRLHRRRDGGDDLRRRAAIDRQRRGRGPRRSRRSPATSPTALFAVGLFGASVLAATIMPISTAFVICEAFGWESGVDKRFARRAGLLRDLHVRAGAGRAGRARSRAST